MDMPVNVPVDDPNADTEWNDILRKHGIIPPKPQDPEPLIQEALFEAQQRAHENRLEDKTLDDLAALEDEEDESFLQQYRAKRLAELSSLQKSSVYGHVYPISKPEYAREVTEESSKAFILVHLSSSNVESRVLGEVFREAARKFGDVKFCEIKAELCIEGYPERNTPTILVYRDGDIMRQVVTLRELNGTKTSLKDVQGLLMNVGAMKEGDVRLIAKEGDEDGDEDSEGDDVRQIGKKAAVEGDDDWD
ncbi:uncharacterized protein Z518_09076 [Rhinocladiella mackenziei CBS 650.93]|uniref:Phosducin domain-containing protein n=1 Tax=Rhinocladiella mackenziei CBS 650.93 TaxID=1442369 RepID=A0A0D2IDN2_9EURO|nr:uncharacterized protein Z518_09076 [Rhinocladiella mackenziei CBS 650.93]KIX01351.1 hypothetical protein Z518_09076 [Rhinocladiella mackenziei CBS 650.93]